MAVDIVPELYDKIKKDFFDNIGNNKKIKKFLDNNSKGIATGEEVSLYAADLGECASKALLNNLTEDALPNGKLYWNIAERTIKPILEEIHEMVTNAAVNQQKLADLKQGIHLSPVKPDFPEKRVNDLLFKLVSVFEEVTDE